MNNSNEFINYSSEDGCTSRGTCSLMPSIAALQALFWYVLKQLSFYILKLDNLKLNNEKLIKDVITNLASLCLINELNEKQLYSLIIQNYYALDNAKNTYKNICKQKELKSELLEYNIEFNENTSLSRSINIGEKILVEEYNSRENSIKNSINILMSVVKSLTSNLCRLYDYDLNNIGIEQDIFKSLTYLNEKKINILSIEKFTKLLSKHDFEINIKLAKELINNFGEISIQKVSNSSRKGKAILVSGTSFCDLKRVLELTKEENIDVYTHSGLLISHALSIFQEYPNLLGHYGSIGMDCIVDFGTFPGAILLTKNSQNNTEFLYRGRIYSNDYNVPQGVIKIENNDFIPLIESAKLSKGFAKGKEKSSTTTGYNEKELTDFLEWNNKSNSYKRLYIIIDNPISPLQKEYLEEFVNNINNDEYIISFYWGESNAKRNIKVLNTGNYYPLNINLINLINKTSQSQINYIFNSCNLRILSTAIYLNKENYFVYMANCSPRVINPSAFETFLNKYKINLTTNAKDDLYKIRNKFNSCQ